MNNHKLIRRTLSSSTTGNDEQEEQSQYTKSVLVLIGYNETTGEPMYIEPCVSNDNPNPYETMPKFLNLLDGLDNEGECGCNVYGALCIVVVFFVTGCDIYIMTD